MADFMYLFRGGAGAGLSAEQLQQQMQKWAAWIQELSKKGKFKAGDPLDRGGKVLGKKGLTVTDGPYAESKDIVGGYVIISAETLDEATELAKGCPIFAHADGSVEIRPVAKM